MCRYPATHVLKGERCQEKEAKDKNYHFPERAYVARFSAPSLPLSVNKLAAGFSKGELTITLPKTTEAH